MRSQMLDMMIGDAKMKENERVLNLKIKDLEEEVDNLRLSLKTQKAHNIRLSITVKQLK